MTQYSKYFFNQKDNTLVVYENTTLYIISRDEMKNFNLAKYYLISQLAYHCDRDIVVFLTAEGQLYAQFLTTKTTVVLKK